MSNCMQNQCQSIVTSKYYWHTMDIWEKNQPLSSHMYYITLTSIIIYL